jgi:HEAT repeat protein
MAMTRKRKLVAGSLAVLAIAAVVIPLQHPYVWQSLFGPRIQGYPLWQWQQEYLRAVGQEERDDYLKLVKDFLGMKRPEPYLLEKGVSRPEAVMILAGLANEPDEAVRRSVAYDLGEMHSEGIRVGGRPRPLKVSRASHVEEDKDARRTASLALIQLLDDPSSEVQTTAVCSLGSIGPCASEAEPRLRQIIDDADISLRLCAAKALWEITNDWRPAGRVARDALKSPDPHNRHDGAHLLRKLEHHDKLAVDELIILYETLADAETRRWALCCIGQATSLKVIPVLINALETGGYAEKREAAQCLMRFGVAAQAAIPSLEWATQSADSDLRRQATDALSRIDPKRYPDRGGP